MLLSLLSAAQQEAQRAQFLVEKAKQEQKQKIVQAEGEATAAKMISCFGVFCGMWLVSLTGLGICCMDSCLADFEEMIASSRSRVCFSLQFVGVRIKCSYLSEVTDQGRRHREPLLPVVRCNYCLLCGAITLYFLEFLHLET